MPSKIPFIFGLSPAEPAVTPDSDLWRTPLPTGRHAFSRTSKNESLEDGVTYGDYFSAARHFLEQNNAALLCAAVCAKTGETVTPADLEQVAVYLVKHGAFYHPAYVIARTGGRRLPLVLNVAVSSEGRKVLDGEYQHIARLNRELPENFWPLVYGHGAGLAQGGRPLPMFLGQWLEGFFEFHLTADSAQTDPKVVVWDTDRGHRILTTGQVQALLGQAASILAYAYNPLTLEAIRNWHHAAGDFIVNPGETGLQVRLITVRRYAPVINDIQPDAATLLEALLDYFVEISLRLRLDRLDGIGSPACHAPEVVPDICRGFFQGLESAAAARRLPQDFAETVKRYFALHGTVELMPIARAVAKKIPAQAGEKALLDRMIEPHVAALATILAE